VKGKSVFPTEIALFKAPYLAVTEAEKRWTMRMRNLQEIMAQLSIFFQERRKDYLC
jgi:transposase-like protein